MEENKCMLCNGHGFVEDLEGDEWVDVKCPECLGTGVDEDEEGR